ncbi:spiroplasma phage ORF1-like family protein, partial [Spiroplasma sp. K1]
MKRFLVWFLTLPILFVSFVQLNAFSFLEKGEVKNEIVRQKRSTNFKINEEDFINTMFLRSSFFENWSDTNYFVNPILKTSKSLIYNENWYLDFLKDSYATGVVFDKPSDKFLELYKNWDNCVKQYNLNRFYNVDKKFFLKDLTNFMYTYFKKYELRSTLIQGKSLQIQQSIKDLQQVKFNEDNWKLITNKYIERDTGWYIIIYKSFNNW